MIKRFAAAFAALVFAAAGAQADPVRIMAAFTFKASLDAVIAVYKTDGGGEITASLCRHHVAAFRTRQSVLPAAADYSDEAADQRK